MDSEVIEDNAYVDLLLRGRLRLREENDAMAEILNRAHPMFRVKNWFNKMLPPISQDARHSMCVARVAAEEIAHLRWRIAELEAELKNP